MSRYGFSITVKLRVRAYTHGGPSLIQARATDMQRSTNTRRYFVLKEDKRRRRNPFLLETPRIRASFEVLISIEGRIHEDTFLLDVSPVSLWQVLAAHGTYLPLLSHVAKSLLDAVSRTPDTEIEIGSIDIRWKRSCNNWFRTKWNTWIPFFILSNRSLTFPPGRMKYEQTHTSIRKKILE